MLSYKPYDLFRASTVVVDGEVVDDYQNIGSVLGSLQPVGAKESAGLPDEFRTQAKYKLYTRNTGIVINGTVSNQHPAVGDEIVTPLGRLRFVGVEQHYPAIVDARLRPVAHGKYYLNGGDGVPNET